MRTITGTELQKLVEDGVPFIKGIYHAGRVDRISVRDKTPGANGARRDMLVAKQMVITGTDSISFSAFLPDASTDAERNWKPDGKKGDKVVVILRTIEENLGAKSGTGEFCVFSEK